MKVSNEVYKKVTIDWANVALPLKEGSPVSSAGVVANSGSAFGIVPQNYFAEPLEKSIYVLVGGHVDLDEIETLFGDEYDDAAIEALNGIHFYKDGEAVPSGGSGGSGGGAFVIGITNEDDVDTMDKTWKEIHDAMASGQIAIILVVEDDDTVNQISIAYVTKNGGSKPYRVAWVEDGAEVVFYATTENDYPSSEEGGGGEA